MKPEFNYKTVYFFLLSLFGIIILLSLMDEINSSLAKNFSIIGLIVCVVAWIMDEQIMHDAGEIRNSGIYMPRMDDPEIYKILRKRIILMWGLFGVLLLLFLITLIVNYL